MRGGESWLGSRGFRAMSGVPTPKDRFTSLDTLALVRELRAIRHARVDKAFDLAGSGWSLALRVPREGRRELLLVPGRFAALLSESASHAEELSPFARELRRLLEGAVMEDVLEPGGERFLEIVLRRSGDPQPTLIALEMFGSGNLVVARGSTIAAVAQTRRWAHRTVAIGAEYARPPARTDPWTIGAAEIEAELSRSRTDLASTLAARLALGGPLAEEVIARGGWDGSEPAASQASRRAPELHRVLQTLLFEVGDRPSGFLYRREGVAVDATPYRSHRWEEVADLEEVVRPTFSIAAAEYFPTLVAAPVSKEDRARSQGLKDLEHQLEQQRTAVAEFERRVEGLKADASAVFDHYGEAETALRDAERRGEKGPVIEVRLGDRIVPLLVGESPRTTAQRLFEESKRIQAKLNGALSAISDAETKLATRRGAAPPASLAESPSGAVPRRRRVHWFERYRWFISSEGGIVIAGRDASTNDLLVRRNLKDGDFYVHADLHGAASVVVKHAPPGEPPVSESTLREAAQWAVAFSKAWRAGLASAEAFWVESDQVSKKAASGEFVARGAWVIHGTKHVLRDLPLELALGTVDYGGDTLWTAAPPEALRVRGKVFVLLSPGPERERSEVEVSLSRDLGLPRPVLQGLLPAGGLSVRRA
jgi:predicted ribosome quality control (RQC) complex YloA/Tae2 family protein